MSTARRIGSPRFVYGRSYVEPEIELLVAEPTVTGDLEELHLLNRVIRYKPTGTRTPGGFYEYELVEESSLA